MTHEDIRDYIIVALVEILKSHNDAHARIEAAHLLIEICDIGKS